jgi:hypothetical protein
MQLSLSEKPMPFPCGLIHWTLAFVMLANILCLSAGSEFAFAAAENPVESASTAAPAPAETAAPAAPPVGKTADTNIFGKALDATHSLLERSILEQTVRFDNFFGDINTDNLRQTRYELRLRNSLRVEHGGSLNYGASVRANFTLSRISERLHLFITGEDDPEPAGQSLPRDPGNPGFDRTTPATHFANTELRYELIQSPAVNLFLGAGVRLSLPFEAFARSRFQYNRKLGDVSLMKFTETVFVKNTDLFGETTEFSLERLFGKDTIIRWASAGTASQEIEGLEWGSEVSMIQALSPLSAITLTGGLSGLINSSNVIQNYRLNARYRRNFCRSWLFYELEPEIFWERQADGRYPAQLAVTFRLEIVFQGTDRPRQKKSPDPATACPIIQQ